MTEQIKAKTASPALIIALISIPIFIGALDLTVVSAVLPHVITDLEIPIQSGLGDASWIVTGYLLVYGAAMAFMGRLSDIYGRRRVYLVSLSIFTLGSLMVAISDTALLDLVLRIYYQFSSARPDLSQMSLNIIIVSRMVQAFGGGAMVPVGMALVGDIYPRGHRAKALGIIAAIDTAGWVVGHLYGGIIVYNFSWKLIFWLNIPICLLALLLIFFALRNLPQVQLGKKMDWLGAVLISAALTFLILGLGSGSEVDIGASSLEDRPPILWLPLIIGLVLTTVLVLQQRKAKEPLFNPGLFKIRNFTFASISNFLIGAALFIAIANVPLFINLLVVDTIEQGALESGFMLSALTIPMALAAIPGGNITEKHGYRLPAVIGLITAIIGFALMSQWQADTSYTVMAAELVFAGIGFGLTLAPITTAVVNAAPENYRGAASAMVLTFRLIGMTVGVSSLTSYGLIRAQKLNELWVTPEMPYNEVVATSMDISIRVINETLLVAGIITLIALFFVIFLKREKGIPDEQ